MRLPRPRWTVTLVWPNGTIPDQQGITTPPASGHAPAYFPDRFWRRRRAERWAQHCQNVAEQNERRMGGTKPPAYRYEVQDLLDTDE